VSEELEQRLAAARARTRELSRYVGTGTRQARREAYAEQLQRLPRRHDPEAGWNGQHGLHFIAEHARHLLMRRHLTNRLLDAAGQVSLQGRPVSMKIAELSLG
jgi:hypothetical protein